MAYGLQIYNETGDEVVETARPVLYAYETGMTKTNTVISAEANALATAAGYPTVWRARMYPGGRFTIELDETNWPVTRVTQWASDAGTYTEVVPSPNDRALAHPKLNLVHGDLVFFDVTTFGLLYTYNMMSYGFTDTTPAGGAAVCEIEGSNNVGYTVASTREPIATPGGTYGLQLFDEAGVKTFDSRQPVIEIYDHFYISADIMARVILDGIAVNLNLSESHPDFRVAAPNHISFWSKQNGNRKYAMIKKVDDNTISISPYFNGLSNPHIQNGSVTRTLMQDTVIIVGR